MKRKRAVFAAVLLVALVLGAGVTVSAYPKLDVTNLTLNGSAPLGAVGSVISIYGSLNLQLTGDGSIELRQVNVTLNGVPMYVNNFQLPVGTNFTACRPYCPFGAVVILPYNVSLSYSFNNWSSWTALVNATLTVTVYGYWSPIHSTPTIPVTLTFQTNQWIWNGPPLPTTTG